MPVNCKSLPVLELWTQAISSDNNSNLSKKQQLLKRNYFRLANTNYTAPFGLSKNAFFMLIDRVVTSKQKQVFEADKRSASAAGSISISLKGTVSRDCFPLFFAQKTLPGPHITRLKLFCDLFRLNKDIRLQNSKLACPSCQQL